MTGMHLSEAIQFETLLVALSMVRKFYTAERLINEDLVSEGLCKISRRLARRLISEFLSHVFCGGAKKKGRIIYGVCIGAARASAIGLCLLESGQVQVNHDIMRLSHSIKHMP